MKKLLFLTAFFCFSFIFSQENWDYLPVEISNNYHGAICPIDENVVHVVSDYGKFYKTIDGGETWSDYDSGVNEFFFDLAFDGPDNGYAVGDKGKILKTTNAGQTWIELSSGTTEALISVAINAANSIWIVGKNGTLLHSINGGTSWVLESSLTIEKLNSIKFKNENIGYFAGDNGVLFYTDNSGADWNQLTIPATEDLFSISITDNNLFLLNGTSHFVDDFSYSAEKFFKSNDNVTWTEYNTDILTGASDLTFVNDSIGFEISFGACLCNECSLQIKKTTQGNDMWNSSFYHLMYSNECFTWDGYADLKFPSKEIGYALIGPRILKTPYFSVGIEDFNRNNSFTIYPNPTTNGNFNLKITSTNTEGLSLEIVDMTGKKIYFENNLKQNNIISTPNISEGIYFVKLLKNGKLVATRKLIKGN